jgi:DNA-binding response OmpR family regulator
MIKPTFPVEVLLVEGDADLAEMVARCLHDAVGANVTHVTSAADALREELTTRHELAIAAMTLDDGDGLALVREFRRRNRAPIIMLGEHPTTDDAIEALRLGVTELLIKPFDLADLMATVQEVVERRQRHRHNRLRYRRLRRMASRIVRERRDLRQRMDLICQDLVQAYRGLAQKVTDSGVLLHEPPNTK